MVFQRKLSKYKTINNNEYFNYNKFGYFRQDYKILKKTKLEELIKKINKILAKYM